MVEVLREIWKEVSPHKGKVFGTIIGLLIGWMILRYGLLRGLFVMACVGVGLYIGSVFDSKGDVTAVIDRFLR